MTFYPTNREKLAEIIESLKVEKTSPRLETTLEILENLWARGGIALEMLDLSGLIAIVEEK